MPLPKPSKGEKKQDFVSRCAGSKVMNKEFPDQKQKLAVCYKQSESFEEKIDEIFDTEDKTEEKLSK